MPNPNNGDFLFRFDSAQGKEFKIYIINLPGQTIVTKTILQPTENQTIKFSIPQLKSGIYNLKVVSEEFENNKKFVVY